MKKKSLAVLGAAVIVLGLAGVLGMAGVVNRTSDTAKDTADNIIGSSSQVEGGTTTALDLGYNNEDGRHAGSLILDLSDGHVDDSMWQNLNHGSRGQTNSAASLAEIDFGAPGVLSSSSRQVSTTGNAGGWNDAAKYGNKGGTGSSVLNGRVPGFSNGANSSDSNDKESNGDVSTIPMPENHALPSIADAGDDALDPGTTLPNNGANSSDSNDNESNGAFPFDDDGVPDDVFTPAMPGDQTLPSIADAGDALDSGSFVQDDSFGNNDPGNSVPEPATMFLMGTGLAGLMAVRRKKMEE